MKWISVEPNPADNDSKPETLPPLDHTVWIIYEDYNGNPVMALGGRSDEGDGWLWGCAQFGCYSKGRKAQILCDDEYRVIYWKEIEWPEEATAIA